MWRQELRAALVMGALWTAICGGLYPVAITVAAQLIAPSQAAGSILSAADGRALGSALVAQPFTRPGYLWPRPSAVAYDGAASGASNMGPLHPALADAARARVAALRAADPENTAPIPVDLVTASGSGLDPHISVAAARYQAARVARARGLPLDAVSALIARHTEGRALGLFGEPRVNVLAVNLALDGLAP
jgi:potassium-transporting ATPase KdpC subunit